MPYAAEPVVADCHWATSLASACRVRGGSSHWQVDSLREVEHIYLTSDGRMSLAGLAGKHVDYVAAAIARVTKELQ